MKTVLSKTPAAKFAENSDKFETALSDFVVNTERLVKLTWLSTPRTGLEHDYVEGRAYEAHFKSKSPLQWMVGVYLAEVYVLFIGEDLTGTYLDFACQVLKELKIKNGNSNFHGRQQSALREDIIEHGSLRPQSSRTSGPFTERTSFTGFVG